MLIKLSVKPWPKPPLAHPINGARQWTQIWR